MSTDTIQRARDVLAKWREYARNGVWSIESESAESSWLGRGTAGNPDLLDALDGVMKSALMAGPLHNSTASIRRHGIAIAAAIMAADERMRA